MQVANQAPSRGKRILRRVGQVLLAAAFLGLVGGGWAYHRARAQMSDSFFGVGEQMMQYTGARRQDAPRDLVLNGQTLRFSSGSANEEGEVVLDYFAQRCADVDGQLVEQLGRLAQEHPEVGREAPTQGPTTREWNGRNGYVACLDVGEGEVPITELARRVARFGATGDVSEIGDMRYVFVEEALVDGHPATHFVALWTEGRFDVDAMFPEQGDAPGRDVPDVTRPPGSRRVLAGYEQGQPYGLTVYASRDGEAVLESHFRHTLRVHGWNIVESRDERPVDAPVMLVAEKANRTVTVVLEPDIENGGTTAAVLSGE